MWMHMWCIQIRLCEQCYVEGCALLKEERRLKYEAMVMG